MAYLHRFVDPSHARSRRSRSAGAVFPRPATADGGVPLSLRDRTFNFRTGGGAGRDFRHFKGYPHPGGIPTNCIGDNWSLTPSPSLTARKVLSILESPRIYEELYGSFHPLVYQRDTLLHASSQGLFWPRQAPHRPHMGSGSRSGVVPMQDYYYDTPYYPQAYAYEEAPSTSYPQNAYLPPSRDISGYPTHHLSNPYLNSASSAAPYSYGYGGTAGGGGGHTTYYPSRPPPRRSKSSLGFYHEPSGMSTMTGDERLWAANDPVEPSSMKYRPSFHSLPRNAGRNQQHRRRLGQQQQFWPDGTINTTAAAAAVGGVGGGGGLEPNVAGLGLDGNGYQYNSDPRRSTGPSYHYQQTGTHWDREYANFRSSMPENLNQTRNSYFQQNYPPSYYPNPFYHSDLEHHPYSSYLAQGTTHHHSTADPYGTMGRRYRDYSNPHHHHQQQQQHLVGNPDDPAYYGGSSSRYDRGQYGTTDASFTANGHTSRMRPSSAAVTANRMSEYHDVPSRSGSMHPQGQPHYGSYGSNTASFYPADYLYQGNMASNPFNSMDVMDRTAQLLEDMHLGRGAATSTMDPYDYKRSSGTAAGASLYDLKRAEYIRRNQQQRSYFDPAHYAPRNRFRGDWAQSAPQVWDEKDLEILAMEKMLDDQNAIQPSMLSAYPQQHTNTATMGGHVPPYNSRQSATGFQPSDPYYNAQTRYHSTGALDVYPKPRSRSYSRRSGRRTSHQRSRSKQTRFEDPLLNKLSSMSKR